MSLGRVDQEQKEYERRRNAAIMSSNYEFIELRLKNYSMRNVAGIEIVHAQDYMNPKTNMEDWIFTLRGGNARFRPIEAKGNALCDWWPKTDHNMKFLASHWKDDKEERYWEIEDKEIEKEVIKINGKMAKISTYIPKKLDNLRLRLKEVERNLATAEPEQQKFLRDERHRLLEQLVEEATGERVEIKKEDDSSVSSVVDMPNQNK